MFPEAHENLENDNFILKFWNQGGDFEEWHEGQLVPVPKSGDLSNPNEWS